MLEFWDRSTEQRLLRALDACCALLGDTQESTARRAVFQRLLAVVFEAGAGTDDPMSELYAADTMLSEIPPGTGLDDTQALAWLKQAQQRRLIAFLEETDSWGTGYSSEEIDEHPMWRIHQLGALPRRLRLLIANTGTNKIALARTVGVPAHQVGHWAAGRSRPGPAERDKLAAALGIHPGWLADKLDDQAPLDWYQFEDGCPCGASDGTFAREPLDGPCADIGAHAEWGLWCAGDTTGGSGCGQPYLIDGDLLYPAPTMQGGYGHRFTAVRDGVRGTSNCGPELTAPWPHSLWNNPAGPNQRGPLRLPDLLTQAEVPP
ncbi:helix-turn-helix transcriptional regulator [Kitasatospora aureofaciens]|uniref:helix-turn-helix domain-containing protein n=1 Tax=Kitasatospora aureofaciens TaxID=1894 RepID=UPI0033D07955